MTESIIKGYVPAAFLHLQLDYDVAGTYVEFFRDLDTAQAFATRHDDSPTSPAVLAVVDISERRHRVRIEAGSWVAEHPVIERLEGTLFDCSAADLLPHSHGVLAPGEYWMSIPARFATRRAAAFPTRHGHPIPGLAQRPEPYPPKISRCGGPGMCDYCRQDTLQAWAGVGVAFEEVDPGE